MRKIFVVLLVLAIAGGALAQEAEVASNWSLTGEGKIATTVDFYGPDEYDGKAWISGGQDGDMFIKMFWDYKKGDWTIALPFAINWDGDATPTHWYFSSDDRDDDTYSGIKYNPNGGPLTLEVPFTLTFGNYATTNSNNNEAWYMFGDVGAGAIYDGGNYWFKVAFDNINTKPAPGAIGGWYDFGENGSRLAVSYNSATDSEWWRASDIVLGAGPWFGSYAWENIGGDYSDYGLAYKYGLNKDFNLGISFAGNLGNGEAGQATFGPVGNRPGIPSNANPSDTYHNPFYDWNFANDFLANFIFGMKYDGAVAISLMAGMWSQPVFVGEWVEDLSDPGNWYWNERRVDLDVRIPLHLGAAWENKDLGISVKGDISALFDKVWKGEAGASEDKIKAWFNFGLQAQYGDSDATDGFWGRLLLKGIDLADNRDIDPSKTIDMEGFGRENDDQVVSTELWVGYQRNVNDDNDGWDKFDGKGTGLWAALYAGFPDFTSVKFRLDSKLGIGYAGLPIIADKLLFNIGATVGLNINPLKETSTDFYEYILHKDNDKSKIKETKGIVTGSFDISPELEWKLIENGNAVFNYTFGMSDFYTGKLDVNKFTASFKYTF